MLKISPKGTVPVLQLADGTVLEESLDIMRWALAQCDSHGWLKHDDAALIDENDGQFKHSLDRYKYATNAAQKATHRTEAEQFLQQLETRLSHQAYLCGATLSITDIAIFPFIRQFAAVDEAWFTQAPYPALRQWLVGLVESELFTGVMRKYLVWRGT
jgi:glutathione S-transferase